MGVMGDSFVEIIVPVRKTMLSYMIQGFLIALTVLMLLAGILTFSILLIAGILLLVVDWFVFRRLNVEYEYSYINGELDIDRIFSKQSRKHAASYKFADIEIAAPAKSDKFADYRDLKIVDYTTGEKQDRENAFAFVTQEKGKNVKVLIKPDERIIKDMRMRGPSKVFLGTEYLHLFSNNN